MFFPVEDIADELAFVVQSGIAFDVVSIVGEGEPTLYLGLGDLIERIKSLTEKPIAVITNGALLSDLQVQKELNLADFVLPTMDAYDEESFRRINRAHRQLSYSAVSQGLRSFSQQYPGHLWLEIMLMKGINDDPESLEKFARILKDISYEKLYLNTPIRPPAEAGVTAVDHEGMALAEVVLQGISIEHFASGGFSSRITDDYKAILSTIKRHPMNQHEISCFLKSRSCSDPDSIFTRLNQDDQVTVIQYKGYQTYRLK
jgi:wyosine [tRNA(Phe)-imidazoG37] synthetase (radical SAM superfamily)